MASVSIEQAQKAFGSTRVIHGVDVSISDGEFCVLVGPSGCGKSTLLRMIAGLEEITAGTIRIGERVVNDVQPKERDIAMVFQNYALYPHMKVRENMAFSLMLAKRPKDEIDRRVNEAAGILSLTPYLDRYPRQLSGGQRQRVAMGRAIVRKPQVFLFDEPLSNLDAKLRVQMRVEIKKLHQRLATTSIYVTHDQVEAMTLGDRVVVMKDGLIQQVGEPLELYNNPANKYVAGFIGSPAMNFADTTIEEAGGAVYAVNPTMKIRVPEQIAARMGPHKGKRATLGIRPEDLRMANGADPEDLSFDAVVEVAEQLGSEIILDLKAGGSAMVASVEPTVRVKPQQKIRLAINPAGLRFFDAATEMAI
ncbi:MAG TPA: sn-glycerol-3-phosphate ABC transporter ATP-binding protein UgpC [Burkholderiaceae bacterium]|nr:sn-glycerol-3-phosphate ABC transporter ATP-binding protein UgpC [Burkholderiaceae bacterium]